MTIILVAHIRGQNAEAADKIQQHLSNIKAVATSDAEPGCHQYQPARSLTDPLDFVVFEEYDDKEAIGAHTAGKEFLAMKNEGEQLFEGGVAGLKVVLYNKF